MSGHHSFLGGGTEERLLYRRRHRVGDGDLRRTDHTDDGLRESAKEDVYYSFLEGDKVVNVNDVRNDDSQDSSSKSAQDGEKICPG
jgi:hypothetical protein